MEIHVTLCFCRHVCRQEISYFTHRKLSTGNYNKLLTRCAIVLWPLTLMIAPVRNFECQSWGTFIVAWLSMLLMYNSLHWHPKGSSFWIHAIFNFNPFGFFNMCLVQFHPFGSFNTRLVQFHSFGSFSMSLVHGKFGQCFLVAGNPVHVLYSMVRYPKLYCTHTCTSIWSCCRC